MTGARLTSGPALLSTSSGINAVPRISGAAALVAWSPPASKKVSLSSAVALVSYSSGIFALPRLTASAAIVSWSAGVRDQVRARAWYFDLDGHTFYVLSLGIQGTYVYDLTTGEWHNWKTGGLETWNMEQGITWKGKVYGGDQINPTTWVLDPDSELDDGFKTMTRIVTAIVPVRQRSMPSLDAFRITAATGRATAQEPAAEPVIELEISDDNGNSYWSAGKITLIDDIYDQEIAWRSLGTLEAPGRVFRIKDTGGSIRISNADADFDTKIE